MESSGARCPVREVPNQKGEFVLHAVPESRQEGWRTEIMPGRWGQVPRVWGMWASTAERRRSGGQWWQEGGGGLAEPERHHQSCPCEVSQATLQGMEQIKMCGMVAAGKMVSSRQKWGRWHACRRWQNQVAGGSGSRQRAW